MATTLVERLTPTPEQEADIARIVSEPTRAALVASDTGAGKAHPLSEPILTPTGWTTMGSVRVGDSLIGKNGQPTKVLSLHPQGIQDIYRVAFNDGTESFCTWEHLWNVQTRGEKHRGEGWKTLPLSEIANSPERWYVPVVSEVEFFSTDVPIDPYLLGVLLGDGGFSSDMVYLSTDYEISESLSLPDDCSLSESFDRHEYSATWRIRGMAKYLREIGLMGSRSEFKFVPRNYLWNDAEKRLALLQGLLDTDGEATKSSNVVFSTTSDQLKDDVIFLARSLGCTVSASRRITHYTHNGEYREGQPSWRLHIAMTGKFIPFRLTRKASKWKPPTKYFPTRKIVSVEFSHRENAQCIVVDAADHLYVTRDFVVTHNTVVAVEVAKRLNANAILVIGPKKTAQQWHNRFVGQGVNLPFHNIAADSKTADSDQAAFVAGVPGVYFVGREFFYLSATKAEKREKRWSWHKARPDIVIVDESHSSANRWGLMATTLKTLHPSFKLMLSATPGRNQFKGLWAPCRWLWPDARNEAGNLIVDNSQWRWAAQYAIVTNDPWAGKKITDEREPGSFVATLPCYIRREAPKVPVETRTVHVELTPRQREVYTAMEKDALAWLGEHPLVADLPIVQKTRLRQIALGEPSIVDGEVLFADDCASAKIEACQKIIAKYHPNDSIVFYTDSQRFAHVLAKRLPDAVEYSGAVSHRDRARIVEDFVAGKIRHLVAVIAAVAEGLDGLQPVCSTEVWLNRSYDGTLNTQAEGRVNRTGQRAPKIIRYELIANDSEDGNDVSRLVKQRKSMEGSLVL